MDVESKDTIIAAIAAAQKSLDESMDRFIAKLNSAIDRIDGATATLTLKAPKDAT
jgi:hypothetical protein